MARRGERTTQTRRSSQPGSGGTAVEERTGDGGAAEGGNGVTETGRRPALTRWPALLAGVPASPWELMRRMSEEMNQLFQSLGGTAVAWLSWASRPQQPG